MPKSIASPQISEHFEVPEGAKTNEFIGSKETLLNLLAGHEATGTIYSHVSQSQPSSMKQRLEQPSPSRMFPSSQPSTLVGAGPATMESPHTAAYSRLPVRSHSIVSSFIDYEAILIKR